MSANATGALLCEKAVRAAVQVLAVRKQLGCVLQCVAVCCSARSQERAGARPSRVMVVGGLEAAGGAHP